MNANFDSDGIKFIYSYLRGRKQKTKMNCSHSSFAEILVGLPQGSILGPLLFNSYICDLFYDIGDTDFGSFADDSSPYTYLSDILSVLGHFKEVLIKYLIGLQNIFLREMLINMTIYHFKICCGNQGVKYHSNK